MASKFIGELKGSAGALGGTAGNSILHSEIHGSRHHLDFKEVRTVNGTDWNNTTYKLQMRVDSTNHQSIDFVSDQDYLEHIDILTGNQVFNTRFTHNGRVGIGTTSPANTLTVKEGSSALSLGDYGGGAVLWLDGIDGDLAGGDYAALLHNENGLGFHTASLNNAMIIKPDASIGVGTTSPVGKFHIRNASSGATPYQSGNGGLTIENSGRAAINLLTPNTQDAYLFFGDPEKANAGYVGYVHSTNRLDVKSEGDIILNTSSNVGVGTASPQGKIHAVNSGNTNIRIESNNGGSPYLGLYVNGVETAYYQAATTGSVLQADTKLNLRVNSTTITEHTEDQITHYAPVQVRAGHNNTRFQLYFPSVTASQEGYLTSWSSEPGISYNCGGIGANVNIGGQYYGRQTSASAYGVYTRYDVNSGYTEFWNTTGTPGTAAQQGTRRAYITEAGSFIASGDVTAYSDARLKSDVVTIEGALDKVSQLRGVDYIKDGKPSTGVIAQEVEAVKPELVHTADDEMGTKSVAYGNMAGLFIEAIKELKDEVAALKAEIAELKK